MDKPYNFRDHLRELGVEFEQASPSVDELEETLSVVANRLISINLKDTSRAEKNKQDLDAIKILSNFVLSNYKYSILGEKRLTSVERMLTESFEDTVPLDKVRSFTKWEGFGTGILRTIHKDCGDSIEVDYTGGYLTKAAVAIHKHLADCKKRFE